VVDASGAPVRQFSVSLDPIIPAVRQPDRKPATGGLTGVATEFEDEAGFFRMKDLDPGTYGIQVSSGISLQRRGRRSRSTDRRRTRERSA
jgi:hypothetical protein